MPETYHIRLQKEQHVFSAAHFITFNANVCERLHGHNYRVTAEIAGPLDENEYVIDFIAVRSLSRWPSAGLPSRITPKAPSRRRSCSAAPIAG